MFNNLYFMYSSDLWFSRFSIQKVVFTSQFIFLIQIQKILQDPKNGFGFFSFITQYFNWTDGCVAVSNKEMDEIWDLVKINTPILITP